MLATCIRRFEAMNFVNVIWGAQCGKSARWVLLGETSSRSHARSVRALARKRQTTARLRKGLPLQGSSLPSSGYNLRKGQHTGVFFVRYCQSVALFASASFVRRAAVPNFSAPLKQFSVSLKRIRRMAVYGTWPRIAGDQVSVSSRRTILAPATMAHIFP